MALWKSFISPVFWWPESNFQCSDYFVNSGELKYMKRPKKSRPSAFLTRLCQQKEPRQFFSIFRKLLPFWRYFLRESYPCLSEYLCKTVNMCFMVKISFSGSGSPVLHLIRKFIEEKVFEFRFMVDLFWIVLFDLQPFLKKITGLKLYWYKLATQKLLTCWGQ